MDGDLNGIHRAEASGHVTVLGGGITGLAAALRLAIDLPLGARGQHLLAQPGHK